MSVDVRAEEYTDRPVTGMDEEGNVFETDAEPGIVEEDITTFSNENEKIVNFNTKGNAVTNYTEADAGDTGYTNGAFGADAAYLGEVNGKVKFMLSGVVGLVNKDQVQVINKSSAKSISHYTVSGGWLIHNVSINMNNGYCASTLKYGLAPSYLAEGGIYFSYDGHYFYNENQYGTMLNDYRNNTRNNSINASNPYYNYYQFLPMRSTSKYSADTINSILANQTADYSKLRGIGNSLVNYQNTYGVNALLTAGVAANESGWGISNLAVSKNNLFGINAVDSNPNDAYAFSSVDACIKYFTESFMSKDYLNPTKWKYYGGFLGNKASGVNVKYASDPYWGEKAAAVAWKLDAAGGNADQYAYTLAIKDTLASSHNNLPVRSESNAGAAVMYKTGTQSNTSFLVQDTAAQNGFYKIYSDGVLNSSRTGIDSASGKYNFGTMHGYIAADSVVLVNQGQTITGFNQFIDVNSNDWYYEYVKFVYERGIMTGLNSVTFSPASELSRAQFATILYRIAGSPATSYSNIFPDVSDGLFYTSPVVWAYNNKVISGYENGNFGPADMITREQMAVLMYRYAKFCGLDISAKGNLDAFPDASAVSSFSKEAMNWAVGAKLIQGDQGKINPQGSASRAQCATIITRFMQYYSL